MKDFKVTDADRITIEKAIHKHFESCRQEVEPFVRSHFSWRQTYLLQKRFFIYDLFLYPLNALWTIPYLTLKQVADSLQKLGLTQLSKKISQVPSGIRTRYQRELELNISEKVFSKSTLLNKIESQIFSELKPHFDVDSYLKLSHHLRCELEKYSMSRQFVSDVAGNLSLMGLGWALFGNHSLSLTALGERLARLFASDKASSRFIFGKSLGRSFYQLFPPAPTQSQIILSTLAVGILFTISSICIHAASDPLRKKLGMHSASILQFLDSLEADLLLEISLHHKNMHLSNSNSAMPEKKKSA